MEIKNNVKDLITLSIAKTQTLQYWVKRIHEVVQSKRKSDFSILNVELLRLECDQLNESFFYAIAHLDLNHPVFLCLDKSFVQNFIYENQKED